MTNRQSDETVELLPCPTPWCGRDNPHYMTWLSHGGHVVHCLHCHVSTPIKATKDEAIACWQDRTTTPVDAEMREALEAFVETCECFEAHDCRLCAKARAALEAIAPVEGKS